MFPKFRRGDVEKKSNKMPKKPLEAYVGRLLHLFNPPLQIHVCNLENLHKYLFWCSGFQIFCLYYIVDDLNENISLGTILITAPRKILASAPCCL